MRVVITGSFQGQDSLGDECLLKAVIERIRYQQADARIVVQLLDTNGSFIRELVSTTEIEAEPGLETVFRRASHVLRRLRVPEGLAESAAQRSAGLMSALDMFGGRAAMDSLSRANAFFIYGGTQFSGMWFKLNAPSYLKSAEIVRASGGKVYFGAQQYGPMVTQDVATLRHALAHVVDDWRTRNELDLELLDTGAKARGERSIYDEVFSAVRLYPSRPHETPAYILANVRHTTFEDITTLVDDRYKRLAALIDGLIDRFDLPVMFFGVSGASFCDDDAAALAVQKHARNASRITSVGRVRDEHHLFDLAAKAKLTLSMSFHGCLLAGIAGSPFIPVTEGNYYDYKYADFDKYTGMQGTPLISLSKCEPASDLSRIVQFVEGYRREVFIETRSKASEMADAFYASAIGH